MRLSLPDQCGSLVFQFPNKISHARSWTMSSQFLGTICSNCRANNKLFYSPFLRVINTVAKRSRGTTIPKNCSDGKSCQKQNQPMLIFSSMNRLLVVVRWCTVLHLNRSVVFSMLLRKKYKIWRHTLTQKKTPSEHLYQDQLHQRNLHDA